MTRGTDTNIAFVFTTPPRPADPQPGTRSAPELDRYKHIRNERDGLLPGQAPAPGPGNPDPREPIAVLSDVLDRDGAELSTSHTRQTNLANADHLATLTTIWTAETRTAQNDRSATWSWPTFARYPTASAQPTCIGTAARSHPRSSSWRVVVRPGQ
jgi:hypothetical protein